MKYVVALALVGCGRIGFAAHGDGDGGTDGGPTGPEATGELDPTFGTGGETVVVQAVAMRDRGYDLTTRGSGYLTIGTLASTSGTHRWELLAFSATGALDPTFQTAGTALIGSTLSDFGYAIANRPDGGFVLTGDGRFGPTLDDVQVGAIDRDGNLLTSFGAGSGYVHFDFDMVDDTSSGVLVRGADTLICATGKQAATSEVAFWLLDIDANGSLVPSFGVNGAVLIQSGGYRCFDLARDASGRILASGEAAGTMLIVRLMPDGTFDQTFAELGALTIGSGNAQGFAILPARGGGMFVGGSSGGTAAVYKLDEAGGVVTSFAGGVATPLGAAASEIHDLQAQPNGKLIAVGVRGDATTNGEAFIARLDPNTGALDTGFGTNGLVVLPRGTVSTFSAVRIAPDGELVAFGWLTDAGGAERPWLVGLR